MLVRLSETDSGTRVDYAADAVIGGMIGGVGQRMLGSVARKTAGEFFAAVEDHLRAPAGALTEDGPHLPAPAAAGPHPRVRETASHEQWAGQAAPREQWAGQVASHGQGEAALARPAVYERPAKQRTRDAAVGAAGRVRHGRGRGAHRRRRGLAAGPRPTLERARTRRGRSVEAGSRGKGSPGVA